MPWGYLWKDRMLGLKKPKPRLAGGERRKRLNSYKLTIKFTLRSRPKQVRTRQDIFAGYSEHEVRRKVLNQYLGDGHRVVSIHSVLVRNGRA